MGAGAGEMKSLKTQGTSLRAGEINESPWIRGCLESERCSGGLDWYEDFWQPVAGARDLHLVILTTAALREALNNDRQINRR